MCYINTLLEFVLPDKKALQEIKYYIHKCTEAFVDIAEE